MTTQTDELNVYRDWLGIPEAELPEDGPPDHYALLRLPRFEDDTEKVRKNYRKLNEHVRTYASGQFGPQSQELLNELAKAMLCLTDPERKRDYDEQHGREFEASAEEARGLMPMGRWLVKQKAISRDQLKEAKPFAEARGLSLRDALVQMKLVKPELAARALAQSMGLSFVDLAETIPDDSVLDKLPRATVKHHSILPLFVDEDVLLVACLDDPPHEIEDELRMRYNVPTRWVIAAPLAMNQAIAKYYAPGTRDSVAELPTTSGKKKVAKPGKPSKAAAGPSWEDLSPDQQHEKKMVGYIIMCWSIIGSMAIGWGLTNYVFTGAMWPYLIVLLLAPLGIFYVLKIYWK